MKQQLALIFIFTIATVLLSFPKGSLSAPCSPFKEFTLFPNPVQVGQTAHIRAVVSLGAGAVTNGSITVSVQFNGDTALQLTNIPLCDSTSSIVCSSLGAGDNALSFDFEVPSIPVGSYGISVGAVVGTNSPICQSFTVNVTDPSHNSTQFTSFILAQLAGTAQFENPDVAHRATGDAVQIGPIGYVHQIFANQYQWGSFMSISGSEDVVVPYLNTKGYVWGLYGNLSDIVYDTTTRNHTYGGSFYVGYVSDLTKDKLDVTIAEGTFSLTWVYSVDSTGATFSTLNGQIHFGSEYGTIPSGWSHPITIERFGSLSISTDEHGILSASGSKTYCLTTDGCPTITEKPPQAVAGGSTGLSTQNIILIVCLTVGVFMLVAIVVVTALWMKRKKRFEEEDGIFSAARKPEYGSALVVDDIIQEAREHGSSPIIPPLNRHPGDTESDEDYDDESDLSEDESALSPPRRSRFSREAGSPSRRRSPSPDERRERGNGRQRSPSVERRSASPPRRDDESSYYSDAGSSASRASSSDD